MIEVKEVTKIYGKGTGSFKALDNVSFTLNDSDTVAITGKSGSGKSTLMHVISGLDSVTSGEILVNGENIHSKKINIDEFRNKEMAFIFQTFFVQPNETVLENVMLPLEIGGISYGERKRIALEALKKVDLEDKANNKAKDLSGGQKQRVCIARAIVGNPNIIFADEPTGNLDSATGEKIIKLLFKIQKDLKCTLIFVTHDDDLAEMCNTRIYLKDGEVTNISYKNK